MKDNKITKEEFNNLMNKTTLDHRFKEPIPANGTSELYNKIREAIANRGISDHDVGDTIFELDEDDIAIAISILCASFFKQESDPLSFKNLCQDEDIKRIIYHRTVTNLFDETPELDSKEAVDRYVRKVYQRLQDYYM